MPDAVSADSITASDPSKIAFATSEASARVGREFVVIDSSICVAVIAKRPQMLARCSTRFCTIGTDFGRKLDAEVAAGDHDAIADVEDVFERIDGLRFLELGDDVDLVAAEVVKQRAQFDDVAAAADERRGDVVELVGDGEGDVFAILFRDRRNRQLGVGEIHPLLRRDRPAVNDARQHLRPVDRGDDQLDQPIIDEDALPELHLARQRRERRGDDRRVAHQRLGRDREHLTRSSVG